MSLWFEARTGHARIAPRLGTGCVPVITDRHKEKSRSKRSCDTEAPSLKGYYRLILHNVNEIRKYTHMGPESVYLLGNIKE